MAQYPPPVSRQYSSHGPSSAFSSSDPDEDWTKISDLAERRRIQNRIAQRNYRKKIKRRLEDLERRAGTSDGASSANEKNPANNSSKKPPPQTPKKQAAVASPKPTTQSQFTPPMHSDEYLFPQTYDDRERSNTPPMFAYSAYPPPPEELLMAYSADQPCGAMMIDDMMSPEQYKLTDEDLSFVDTKRIPLGLIAQLPRRSSPRCEPCGTSFSRPGDLIRHQNTIHSVGERKFRCGLCSVSFSRSDGLRRHNRICHKANVDDQP